MYVYNSCGGVSISARKSEGEGCKTEFMVKITGAEKNFPGYQAGVRAGDFLVSINGPEINDVLDYRFYLTEQQLTVHLTRGGVPLHVEIHKEQYQDIGLDFETPLMDQKRRCENKCIFCFIDQLPQGMRESLYFKDDDSRLSFLHGNYITMTNLSDRDIDRIIEMHISPVNISVHTTEPALRCQMMRNRRAGDTLRYLRRLADAGCELRCQIVLCRGVNDGVHLDATLHDLAALYPALQSTSVVPAGLTAYRTGLYPLKSFTRDECRAVVRQVEAFTAVCRETCGQNLFFCADEFYVKGGLPLPDDAYYEEYAQIENGVGMLTSFRTGFDFELSMLTEEEKRRPREISIATGAASYAFFRVLTDALREICPHLVCRLYEIKNEFFGGEITVTGLLTGRDLQNQLRGQALGTELLLSRSMLRSDGDLFLCGMTPEELSDSLGVPLRMVENDGGEFVRAVLGLL